MCPVHQVHKIEEKEKSLSPLHKTLLGEFGS